MEVQEGRHHQPACLVVAVCAFIGQRFAVCPVERFPAVSCCRKGCQRHVASCTCRSTVKPAHWMAVYGQVAAAGNVCCRDARQIDDLQVQDRDTWDCVQAGHMTNRSNKLSSKLCWQKNLLKFHARSSCCWLQSCQDSKPCCAEQNPTLLRQGHLLEGVP